MINLTDITMEQKAVLFDTAVEEGLLNPQAAVEAVLRKISKIQSEFAALVGSAVQSPDLTEPLQVKDQKNAPKSTKPPRQKKATKPAAKSPVAVTPERLASRKLQGRYLALVRQFSKAKRAEFAKIAKEHGRETAIKSMEVAKKAAGKEPVATAQPRKRGKKS